MRSTILLTTITAFLATLTTGTPIENLSPRKTGCFKISATSSALSPHKQYLVSDDAATSPNQFGILVSESSSSPAAVWSLNPAHHLADYKTRYAQQDAGQTSQWIWVDTPANIAANGWIYVDFFMNEDKKLTAKKEDNGNSVLQVCELSKGLFYLDLANKKGLTETAANAKCWAVELKAEYL